MEMWKIIWLDKFVQLRNFLLTCKQQPFCGHAVPHQPFHMYEHWRNTEVMNRATSGERPRHSDHVSLQHFSGTFYYQEMSDDSFYKQNVFLQRSIFSAQPRPSGIPQVWEVQRISLKKNFFKEILRSWTSFSSLGYFAGNASRVWKILGKL